MLSRFREHKTYVTSRCATEGARLNWYVRQGTYRFAENISGEQIMELISKIYVTLIELILSLLVAVPLVVVIIVYATGGNSSSFVVGQWFKDDILTMVGLVLVYYLILVSVFGLISISISNYRNLNRIANLLERQDVARKISEPLLAKPTKMEGTMGIQEPPYQ